MMNIYLFIIKHRGDFVPDCTKVARSMFRILTRIEIYEFKAIKGDSLMSGGLTRYLILLLILQISVSKYMIIIFSIKLAGGPKAWSTFTGRL